MGSTTNTHDGSELEAPPPQRGVLGHTCFERESGASHWMPLDGTGAPVPSRTLPREPESAAVARLLVRSALETWALSELTDSATLVVTELVANAADHACGSCIRVTVTRTAECRVRVAVVDRDHTPPQLRPATLDEERGRGLWLVDAMSAVWGVDLLRWGKRVWAELEAV